MIKYLISTIVIASINANVNGDLIVNKPYKGQFESWQPGYPAVFHKSKIEVTEFLFRMDHTVRLATIKTHNITINAIKKAGGYE